MVMKGKGTLMGDLLLGGKDFTHKFRFYDTNLLFFGRGFTSDSTIPEA